MTDHWRIELGPDDTKIMVKKNGETFCVKPVRLTGLGTLITETLDFVMQQATAGDEIVIHASGILA